MEIFLFVALAFIYALMSFLVPSRIVRRVWIAAYTVAFLLTAVAVWFVTDEKQTVLLAENEWNWYYFLYLFGSMSVILGVINLWIYRNALIRLFSREEETSEDDD